MLDVHPPHDPTHTWADFFIHIATIVVGLLIAVGLEQTVEAIHHHHQRTELRESLDRESDQILRDAAGTTATLDYHLAWLQERTRAAREAVWADQPVPPRPPYKAPAFDYPDDPLWRSAKSSGLTELLSTDERNAYSEVELLASKVDLFYDRWRDAESARLGFEKEFPLLPDNNPDFSRATPQDKRAYLKLLMAEAGATGVFRAWNGDLIGAEHTIRRNDLNLEDIFAAEKKEQDSRLSLGEHAPDSPQPLPAHEPTP